jgi:ribosome-associated protein
VSSTNSLRPELRSAIAAAQDKKAADVTLLDLAGLGAFTDAFLLCTGFSSPQLRAISDGVEEALEQHGLRPAHREGRGGAEWLLLDYGSFIVHIFTERLRQYYDLERLWRMARRIDFSEPAPGESLSADSVAGDAAGGPA